MRRIAPLSITAVAIIALGLAFLSCKKNNHDANTDLYGTWVKGANAGDTLQFMRKNNKDILRYNISLNSAWAFSEAEYQYKQGKLSIKLYAPTSQDYYPISSFTWKQTGSEFEIQGVQLFPILSSTQLYFTYRKI